MQKHIFLLNESSPKALDVAKSNFADTIKGNASCEPDPKVKVSGKICILLSMPLLPSPWTYQLQIWDVHISKKMYRVLGHLSCDLTVASSNWRLSRFIGHMT